MSTQALNWRTGRPIIVVMMVAVVAFFATTFGGEWIARADGRSGTNPNTVPGTVTPDPQPDAPANINLLLSLY